MIRNWIGAKDFIRKAAATLCNNSVTMICAKPKLYLWWELRKQNIYFNVDGALDETATREATLHLQSHQLD